MPNNKTSYPAYPVFVVLQMSVEIMSGAKPSAQQRSATGQEKEPRPKPTVKQQQQQQQQQQPF